MSAARLTSHGQGLYSSASSSHRWTRQCSLPAIHSSLQGAPFHDVRLGGIDLGFNCRQLVERGCVVNAVPQSKIETGIHGDRVEVAWLAAAYVPQQRDQVARIAPTGVDRSLLNNS